MTYVIAEPCVDLKDKACVEECPVEAIYYEDDLPARWKDYYTANVEFFTVTTQLGSPGGASKVGRLDADHAIVAALPPHGALPPGSA